MPCSFRKKGTDTLPKTKYTTEPDRARPLWVTSACMVAKKYCAVVTLDGKNASNSAYWPPVISAIMIPDKVASKVGRVYDKTRSLNRGLTQESARRKDRT